MPNIVDAGAVQVPSYAVTSAGLRSLLLYRSPSIPDGVISRCGESLRDAEGDRYDAPTLSRVLFAGSSAFARRGLQPDAVNEKFLRIGWLGLIYRDRH
jgi:hypothetical protein